jgi:hypothetical protein
MPYVSNLRRSLFDARACVARCPAKGAAHLMAMFYESVLAYFEYIQIE